ncbi:MAG: class I SAM-dependent methyltransferase [Planctomycetia bacterium]|nr:class I SAM-dependent methyltransferase [Planctomycetia bacterium]
MNRRGSSRQLTTISCYTFFDKVFPDCGLLDFTEGMYHGDPTTPYETAQRNQIRYLLDEVGCGSGTRLLDVGCGNGNLLEEARNRGARPVGITISPEQVRRCQSRGLDARLVDYKNLGDDWTGHFDAVIANGPIEHFVHPEDAIDGQADSIYRKMFAIFHRAIDPSSASRKVVNTTIHFVRQPDPSDLLKSPLTFPRGSDSFHWAFLERSFGGFYPALGQLEECAAGYFSLEKTIDGTYDYFLTSETWLRRVNAELRRMRKIPRILARSFPFALRHPRQCATMLACMLVTQSWNWQFRTANPPTRLLRQTWRYR